MLRGCVSLSEQGLSPENKEGVICLSVNGPSPYERIYWTSSIKRMDSCTYCGIDAQSQNVSVNDQFAASDSENDLSNRGLVSVTQRSSGAPIPPYQ